MNGLADSRCPGCEHPPPPSPFLKNTYETDNRRLLFNSRSGRESLHFGLTFAVFLLFRSLLLYFFLSPRQCHLSPTLASLNPVLALPSLLPCSSLRSLNASRRTLRGISTPYLVPFPPLAHETVLLPRSTFRSLALRDFSLFLSCFSKPSLALNDDLRPPPLQHVAVEGFEDQEVCRGPDSRRVCSLPRRSPRQRTQARDFVERLTRLC